MRYRRVPIALAIVAGTSMIVGPGCAHTKKLNEQIQSQQAALNEMQGERDGLAEQLNKARAEISKLEQDVKAAEAKAAVQPPPSPAPEPQPKDRCVVTLAGDMFAPGKESLTPAAKQEIQKALGELRSACRDTFLRIEGHTDSTPLRLTKVKFKSNYNLAAQRALSVLEYLKTVGKIDPARMYIASYGPHRPVAENGTQEGRAHNRRVVIIATDK